MLGTWRYIYRSTGVRSHSKGKTVLHMIGLLSYVTSLDGATL